MSAPAYSDKLAEAMAFITDQFRFKVRKGTGVPYLTHLMCVAAMVGEGGGDEEQIIAALCHDYLEDIPGASEAELIRRFGPRVNAMVVALSDCAGEPKPPWRERKDAYLAALSEKSADVKLIAAADKLHNCGSLVRDHLRMGDAIFERFNAKKSGTLWYYRELLPPLRKNWSHYLLEDLGASVQRLYKIAEVPWIEP
jgi:(p)ppGpp synthase/HD superfamily hydrolase